MLSRISAGSFILLLFSVSSGAAAQTAAQQALNKEPEVIEMRRLQQNQADLRDKTSLPNGDIRKPSTGVVLGQSFMNLKGHWQLAAHLEERLQKEAIACHFCSAKQEELSEFMRQEVEADLMMSSMYPGATGDTAVVMNALGFGAPIPDYWKSELGALDSVLNETIGICERMSGKPATVSFHDCDLDARINQEKYTEAHEKAWSSCFNRHDWVKTGSERAAYEACMLKDDPLTRGCAQAPKPTNPDVCHANAVHSGDVKYLRNYDDRFRPGRPGPPETVELVESPTYQATSLEPLIANPPTTSHPGSQPLQLHGKAKFRLNEPVEGVGQTSYRRVIIAAVGSEVDCPFVVSGFQGNSKIPYLQIDCNGVTANGVLVPSRTLYLREKLESWPQAGGVALPKNTSVVFSATGKQSYTLSSENFKKLVTSNTVSGDGSVVPNVSAGRRLRSGTSLDVVLQEPVTMADVREGKLVRAVIDKNDPIPANGVGNADIVRAITAVYVKASVPQSGLSALVLFSIDHVTIEGSDVSVRSNTPALYARGRTGTSSPGNTELQPAKLKLLFLTTADAPIPDAATGANKVESESIKATNAVPKSMGSDSSAEDRPKAPPPSPVPAAVNTLRRIPAHTMLHLSLEDMIDGNSVAAKKIFRAILVDDLIDHSHSGSNSALLLKAGTTVYLKALPKSEGNARRSEVAISVDHIMVDGQEVMIDTVPLERAGSSSATSAEHQGSPSTLSVPRMGRVQIPRSAGTSSVSNAVFFAPKARLFLAVKTEAILPAH